MELVKNETTGKMVQVYKNTKLNIGPCDQVDTFKMKVSDNYFEGILF